MWVLWIIQHSCNQEWYHICWLPFFQSVRDFLLRWQKVYIHAFNCFHLYILYQSLFHQETGFLLHLIHTTRCSYRSLCRCPFIWLQDSIMRTVKLKLLWDSIFIEHHHRLTTSNFSIDIFLSFWGMIFCFCIPNLESLSRYEVSGG